MPKEAGEILAGIEPHPASIGYIPGGIRALTSAELAGIMSGLTDEKVAILRGAELMDHSGFDVLLRRSLYRLASYPEIQAQSLWPKNRLRYMVTLAYAQLTTPVLSLCEKCKGRQNIPTLQGVIVKCDKCDGTGKQRVSMDIQSQFIGVNPEAWRRTWLKIYENTALSLLSGWLESARYHVVRKYYGN